MLIGAAHDLLATHLTGDGRRSDVSPLISGVDGRRQVTVAAASLAKAVADVVSTIGPQDLDPGRRSDPATTQRHLLWGAGIVRTAASGSAPAPDYLHAVASMPVTRRPALRLGEPQDQLLEAILAGVARLHDAAMSDSGQGRVHHHHARSLHTVATAMTATHAICGQLLAQLSAAGSPIEGAFLPPAAAGQLADAARRQQAAFDAWLRVCDSWSGVKGLAETGRSAQLRLEASDMVTRLWDRVDGLEWISYPASSRTAEHSQGVCLLPISGLS